MRTITLLVLLAASALACTPTPSDAPSPSSNAPSASPLSSGPSPSVEPSADPSGDASPALSRGPLSWKELEPPGDRPSAREDHTWTFAGGTGLAFLFGGRDGNAVFEDLWIYDLETDRWRAVEPHGDWPRARFGHEAVWVAGRGLLIWAGQLNGSTFYDDLWLYDPERDAWERLPDGGERPTARYGSCSALAAGRLWVSHGFTADGSRFADTWVYDLVDRDWAEVTPSGQLPVERCLHACWTTSSGGLVLYAGQTTGVAALGDLWQLDAAVTASASWRKVEGALPPERRLYAHASWMGDEVVIGGAGLDGAFLDDAHVVDGETLAFEPLEVEGASPPGRSGAELIADPTRDRLLLFGGLDATGTRDDLWEFSFR
jgi:hypothetical protein